MNAGDEKFHKNVAIECIENSTKIETDDPASADIYNICIVLSILSIKGTRVVLVSVSNFPSVLPEILKTLHAFHHSQQE